MKITRAYGIALCSKSECNYRLSSSTLFVVLWSINAWFPLPTFGFFKISSNPQRLQPRKAFPSIELFEQIQCDVLGPVVQSWISVNPGLKFNPLSWFLYFCTSAYFKTSEKKTPFDPDKISEGICPSL